MVFDETDGESSEPGEILGEGAVADAAVVFSVGHVEGPVERVFNPPVAADGLSESFAVAA